MVIFCIKCFKSTYATASDPPPGGFEVTCEACHANLWVMPSGKVSLLPERDKRGSAPSSESARQAPAESAPPRSETSAFPPQANIDNTIEHAQCPPAIVGPTEARAPVVHRSPLPEASTSENTEPLSPSAPAGEVENSAWDQTLLHPLPPPSAVSQTAPENTNWDNTVVEKAPPLEDYTDPRFRFPAQPVPSPSDSDRTLVQQAPLPSVPVVTASADSETPGTGLHQARLPTLPQPVLLENDKTTEDPASLPPLDVPPVFSDPDWEQEVEHTQVTADSDAEKTVVQQMPSESAPATQPPPEIPMVFAPLDEEQHNTDPAWDTEAEKTLVGPAPEAPTAPSTEAPTAPTFGAEDNSTHDGVADLETTFVGNPPQQAALTPTLYEEEDPNQSNTEPGAHPDEPPRQTLSDHEHRIPTMRVASVFSSAASSETASNDRLETVRINPEDRQRFAQRSPEHAMQSGPEDHSKQTEPELYTRVKTRRRRWPIALLVSLLLGAGAYYVLIVLNQGGETLLRTAGNVSALLEELSEPPPPKETETDPSPSSETSLAPVDPGAPEEAEVDPLALEALEAIEAVPPDTESDSVPEADLAELEALPSAAVSPLQSEAKEEKNEGPQAKSDAPPKVQRRSNVRKKARARRKPSPAKRRKKAPKGRNAANDLFDQAFGN